MSNWLQRLETAWSRRYVSEAAASEDLDGRKPVCIISGGSEGIGRCLADEFARAGHKLLLVARTESKLEQAASELRRDHGVEVHIASIDLAAADCLEKMQAALDANGLYADILVNNAGIGLGGIFAEQSPDRLNQLVALNIASLTALTRHFLPDMLRRGRGGVLNLASLGGLMPGPYQAAYYASKAYVMSLSQALAYENAGRGVRISAAAPGPVGTRFHEKMGVKSARYLQLQLLMPPELAAKLIFSAFAARKTIIVPGIIPSLNSFAVRYIPDFILVPFIGWFLKQRY